MKTFVVNLEKDIARKEFMEKQLNKLEVPFDFFPAVLGKSLTEKELKQNYNDKKAFIHQCRSLVLAEIGCALSHINIYKKMVEEDIQVACIFEDDVILPAHLKDSLKLIEIEIDKKLPEAILLSPAETKGVGILLNENHQLSKYKNGFYTSAYVINLLGAKVMLKELYPVNDVADCWSRLNKHKIIKIRAVVPTLTEQQQEVFGSSTTDDINNSAKYSLRIKIKFKMCRLFWKTIDAFLAIYHRIFRPYSGILK